MSRARFPSGRSVRTSLRRCGRVRRMLASVAPLANGHGDPALRSATPTSATRWRWRSTGWTLQCSPNCGRTGPGRRSPGRRARRCDDAFGVEFGAGRPPRKIKSPRRRGINGPSQTRGWTVRAKPMSDAVATALRQGTRSRGVGQGNLWQHPCRDAASGATSVPVSRQPQHHEPGINPDVPGRDRRPMGGQPLSEPTHEARVG